MVLLELTAAASATDAAIQKKMFVQNENINNFKLRNGRYHENIILNTDLFYLIQLLDVLPFL